MVSKFVALITLVALSFFITIALYIWGFGLEVKSWGIVFTCLVGNFVTMLFAQAVGKEISGD